MLKGLVAGTVLPDPGLPPGSGAPAGPGDAGRPGAGVPELRRQPGPVHPGPRLPGPRPHRRVLRPRPVHRGGGLGAPPGRGARAGDAPRRRR